MVSSRSLFRVSPPTADSRETRQSYSLRAADLPVFPNINPGERAGKLPAAHINIGRYERRLYSGLARNLQPKPHHCPPAKIIFDFDCPVMLGHNPLGHDKAQSAAIHLGGEKRRE